jgi:hypothetical protein
MLVWTDILVGYRPTPHTSSYCMSSPTTYCIYSPTPLLYISFYCISPISPYCISPLPHISPFHILYHFDRMFSHMSQRPQNLRFEHEFCLQLLIAEGKF